MSLSINAPQEIGTLIVFVLKAKNLPNRRTLGKQDPYCTVRIGQNAQSSNIDRRGGQRPEWNHEIRFPVYESDEHVKITVLDDNDSRPELIGDARIDLKQVLQAVTKVEFDKWHEIQFRSKYAGEVYLEMTFYPNKDYVMQNLRKQSVSDQVQRSPSKTISRRPLPASPGRTGSSTPSSTQSSPSMMAGLFAPVSPIRQDSVRHDSPLRPHSSLGRRPLPVPPSAGAPSWNGRGQLGDDDDLENDPLAIAVNGLSERLQTLGRTHAI